MQTLLWTADRSYNIAWFGNQAWRLCREVVKGRRQRQKAKAEIKGRRQREKAKAEGKGRRRSMMKPLA